MSALKADAGDYDVSSPIFRRNPLGTDTDPCESSGLSSQEFAVEATSMPMSGQIALACSVNHSDCIQIVTRLYDHAQAVNAVVDANGGSVVALRPSNPVSRMGN
jgi:hypothetical protein